jgi:hypothetical protein
LMRKHRLKHILSELTRRRKWLEEEFGGVFKKIKCLVGISRLNDDVRNSCKRQWDSRGWDLDGLRLVVVNAIISAFIYRTSATMEKSPDSTTWRKPLVS